MAILSIDLAYKSYGDIGAVVLSRDHEGTSALPVRIPLAGDPDPEQLGEFIAALCAERGIRAVLLDGPQAWKAEGNGLEHSRVCERQLNTPAKTGLPGAVKPANYRRFVEFSIAVFDELSRLGWSRLAQPDALLSQGTVAIESFPLAAWRSLGLKDLPAKSKAAPKDLASSADDLRKLLSIRIPLSLNHDELQATVGGIAGLVFEMGGRTGCAAVGVPPFLIEGFWREGFILNPALECVGALSNTRLQPAAPVRCWGAAG